MADDIDRAQERQELKMAARLQIVPRFDAPSLAEYDDCGEDIPSQRQAIGGVRHANTLIAKAYGRES